MPLSVPSWPGEVPAIQVDPQEPARLPCLAPSAVMVGAGRPSMSLPATNRPDDRGLGHGKTWMAGTSLAMTSGGASGNEFAAPRRTDSVTGRAGQDNGFLKTDPYVPIRGAFEGHHYRGAVNTASMGSDRPLNDSPLHYLRSLDLSQEDSEENEGLMCRRALHQQFAGRGNPSGENVNRCSPNSEILP